MKRTKTWRQSYTSKTKILKSFDQNLIGFKIFETFFKTDQFLIVLLPTLKVEFSQKSPIAKIFDIEVYASLVMASAGVELATSICAES